MLKYLYKGGRIRTGVRENKMKRGIYMNDIMSSPAFQEFLQKRCEEITANDEEYQELTRKSMAAYNNLRKAFAEFVNLSTQLQAYSEKSMFEAGINTAQNNAHNSTNHNEVEKSYSNMARNAINL